MKATKVILPNGKERILIEVKPKEYEAVENLFTDQYSRAPGGEDEKERKRMETFDTAQRAGAESFDSFVERKDDEAA